MALGKPSTTKPKQKAGRKSGLRGNTEFSAILWFALSVFLLCLVFIKGQNVWTHIHNFIFGIFGITAFFYPFILGLISILFTLDKMKGAIRTKIIEGSITVVFINAIIDIFAAKDQNLGFWKYLGAAYKNGVNLKSGGLLGAFIGKPLSAGFGKSGALITLFLLLFVLIMLLTSTSLLDLIEKIKNLFNMLISSPLQSAKSSVQEAYSEPRETRQPRRPVRQNRQFNIDLPVDDGPSAIVRHRDPLNSSQQKVVDAYQGKESAKNGEFVLIPKKDENNGETPAVDVKAETANFTEKVKASIDNKSCNYSYPPLTLLKAPDKAAVMSQREAKVTAENLVNTLKSFGVETRIVDICQGPTVTRYELQPCAGVKISRITALADDIALNLAAGNVRIEAPIPNKAAVGIEVPNKEKNTVTIREILQSPEFTSAKSKLTVALGKDISGNIITADISKMPHGLIAGATGSGKSVCTNSMLLSLLYKNSPEELKLLLIDPKTVEFEPYNGIPHLLVPVVTDPRKAAGALGWAVSEMEKRYKMLSDRKVRNIEEYNETVASLEDEGIEKMPHIVIIIDELADLMQTASKEVEDSIARLAAKARAAGLHMILATQRPSVDVITGVIKANIPTRIALTCSSQIDSRTIIDAAGAEKLLGRGDMLFDPVGSSKPRRLQGCFVSNEEIKSVVDFIKGDRTVTYDDNVMHEIERQAAIDKKQKTGLEEDGPSDDPMVKDAIRVVVENGMASTSLLQRKLKLGYARAARIIDEMEERGIVGPYEGSKPRKVLISPEQLAEMELSSDE
jgi:S-DNA-T family DNA segregation ATPase FtsK/SpoIIIE